TRHRVRAHCGAFLVRLVCRRRDGVSATCRRPARSPAPVPSLLVLPAGSGVRPAAESERIAWMVLSPCPLSQPDLLDRLLRGYRCDLPEVGDQGIAAAVACGSALGLAGCIIYPGRDWGRIPDPPRLRGDSWWVERLSPDARRPGTQRDSLDVRGNAPICRHK